MKLLDGFIVVRAGTLPCCSGFTVPPSDTTGEGNISIAQKSPQMESQVPEKIGLKTELQPSLV